MTEQVSNRVLTASNLIGLFLKDKVTRELSALTEIGDITVTYEIKEHAQTNYGVLFTANIEMFDDDVEEFLPYQSQWLLDVVQVIEWASNQDKFDSYRVKP